MDAMKRALLFLLVLGWTVVQGCTGDCMTCHPNLLPTIEEDARHKPMLTCINCHSADTDAMAECGSDCFACHRVEKIERAGVKEHAVIRECRDCHMKMKADVADIATPRDRSNYQPLKEVLDQQP
jgi:hypothetical protein